MVRLASYPEGAGASAAAPGRLVPRRAEVAVSAPAPPEHIPVRPTWLCRACSDPWPCRPARDGLLVEHADDLVLLAVFMATTMTEAVYDLIELNAEATPTPAGLWDRFMAWLDAVRREGRR